MGHFPLQKTLKKSAPTFGMDPRSPEVDKRETVLSPLYNNSCPKVNRIEHVKMDLFLFEFNEH